MQGWDASASLAATSSTQLLTGETVTAGKHGTPPFSQASFTLCPDKAQRGKVPAAEHTASGSPRLDTESPSSQPLPEAASVFLLLWLLLLSFPAHSGQPQSFLSRLCHSLGSLFKTPLLCYKEILLHPNSLTLSLRFIALRMGKISAILPFRIHWYPEYIKSNSNSIIKPKHLKRH